MAVALKKIIETIKKSPYGSVQLIDAVEKAMEIGIDFSILDELLQGKDDNLPDSNPAILKFWKKLAGKPNINHADFIFAKKRLCKGGRTGGTIYKMPPQVSEGCRRNKMDMMVG